MAQQQYASQAPNPPRTIITLAQEARWLQSYPMHHHNMRPIFSPQKHLAEINLNEGGERQKMLYVALEYTRSIS